MKRVPRLLLVAIALSLLIHLIIALILHPPSPTPESQAEVVSIQHRSATIAVTKTTPPPPRPKQTPAPRTPSSAPPARKGPGTRGISGGTAASPAPIVARATPQPTAAPSAGCVQSNIEAAVIATPPPPDIPLDARASGTSGVALVSVRVGLERSGNGSGR